MLQAFLEFWTFNNPNVIWVVSGTLLLSVVAGTIGCFAFLSGRSLVGDALAHAALPGITTSFLLLQNRSPLVILIGALISCGIGIFCIEYLRTKTRIQPDSALAIVLSLFFGIGIVQLTYIQKLPTAGQAGLDAVLFGKAASLVREDVIVLGITAALILICVAVCFSKLRAVIFDREYSVTMGIPIKHYEFLLAFCTVLAIVIGLQLVGVVLIAALLLTPPAAARYWTNHMPTMLLLSAVFGALSGLFGANISYIAPRMPTGPWVVVIMTILFAISLLAAPERGIIFRVIRRRNIRRRIQDENILRTIYKQAEKVQSPTSSMTLIEVLKFRNLPLRLAERSVQRLVNSNLINRDGKDLSLTNDGFKRAQILTRYHRLWELYLTERIDLPADHVHADAEEIEHFLTPQLEEQLLEELSVSEQDPHGKVIPKGVTND